MANKDESEGQMPSMRTAVEEKGRANSGEVPGMSGQAIGDQWTPEVIEGEVKNRYRIPYVTKASLWADWFIENVQNGCHTIVPKVSKMTRRQISYALKVKGINHQMAAVVGGVAVWRR